VSPGVAGRGSSERGSCGDGGDWDWNDRDSLEGECIVPLPEGCGRGWQPYGPLELLARPSLLPIILLKEIQESRRGEESG
jgi:hypothetical protein